MDTYQCKYDDWMKSNSSKAVQWLEGGFPLATQDPFSLPVLICTSAHLPVTLRCSKQPESVT